jgi:outer membrane protein OmpU
MKKKLLLGTTALIAAGVATSGVAQAAEEPITAGVSGYFRTAMAFISQDDATGELADAAQSHTIGNDIEINVGGSTTLDNGITAGFSANIEGNGRGDEAGGAAAAGTGSAALDERFVFFRGGFGQIRVGQVESARQDMTNFAPSGNYNFGVNTPFFIFGNPGNGAGIFNVRTYSDGLGNEDNMKLVYFSPTFNGFRIGASYSPEDGQNGQYGGNGGDATGGFQNNASAAIEYSNDFGDFNLRVMGGYESYVLENCGATPNLQACENNPDSVQFGGTIGFGSWSIGGGHLTSEQVAHDANGNVREREDWDIGIAWWSGAFGVGLQYGQAEVDIADNTTDEFKIYELNATYVLGPGIDIGAAIRRGDYDDATAGANLDNEFTEIGVSAALSF